jgi:hypothetical protein
VDELLATAQAHSSAVDWGDVPAWVTAVAALLTLVIAAFAVLAAFRQAGEARRLREQQAAPYVVVDVEGSKASTIFLDLYVKNIGRTVARNVRVSFDPPLQSTLDGTFVRATAGFLAHPIPAMPPGREYRMMFERGPDLYKSELPRAYAATVMFDGVSGPQCLTYEINLDLFFEYQSINVYGVHDVATNLRDIQREMKRWTTPGRLHGILVHTLDERDEQRRDLEHFESMRQQRQAENDANESGPAS